MRHSLRSCPGRSAASLRRCAAEPGPILPRVVRTGVVQGARTGMTPAQAMIAFRACALCRRVLRSSANSGASPEP
ncbi:MAG: hypothetical protein EKK33_34630 [Bradyrhizobiaceae bacterium]|nr:MAG: hypothetical protein EKK33_34630 [Bradyrhizobiaceae bacterium]